MTDDMIEKAARVIANVSRPDGWSDASDGLQEYIRDEARALAKAGLLTNPAAILRRLAELTEEAGKARSTEWLRTCATLPLEQWPPAPAYKGPVVSAAEHAHLTNAVAEAVHVLREAGVIHGEGLAERVRNIVVERDQLKARLDRLRFEIENTTLPVGALQQMSDAVNLVHPVSEEDDDVPYTELRARRAMDLVYDWLRTIRAIPAALQGDAPTEPATDLERADNVPSHEASA